jgi:hypothetical protein
MQDDIVTLSEAKNPRILLAERYITPSLKMLYLWRACSHHDADQQLRAHGQQQFHRRWNGPQPLWKKQLFSSRRRLQITVGTARKAHHNKPETTPSRRKVEFSFALMWYYFDAGGTMKIWILALLFSVIPAYGQMAKNDRTVSLQAGDAWTKLYLASSSGFHSGSAAGAMFGGSVKVVAIYRDATAPAKSLNGKPVFRLVGVGDIQPRDILIVRMDAKKDHREIVYAKAGAYTGLKLEFPPSITTSIDVVSDNGGLLITPHVDLKPGEYLLILPSPVVVPVALSGYDFSVPKS